MAVQEIRRVGIDPTQNKWDFAIYGDPSQAPGFQPAPIAGGTGDGTGSRATQFDSSPAGAVWAKIGPNPTDWVQVAFGLTRPITTLDLPSLGTPVEQSVLGILQNPVANQNVPALADGTIDDVRFALQVGPI